MSNAKFMAAKELMQEGHYDTARAVLKTINDPIAQKWLKRIDELDPPFPEHMVSGKSEQEKYYERENRSASRRAKMRAIGDGFYFILMGLVMLGAWLVFSGLLTGRVISNPFSGMNLLMFGMAILLFVLAFFRLSKRS